MSNYKRVFSPGEVNDPFSKAFDLVKKGSTVLDVGCSAGYFGEALIEHKGCTVDGVEPDPGDFKEATKRLRRVANSFVEEAMESTFKGQKYDHIVFLDVIEHLYDPVATLKLVKTHLKPGGSVIFSIPNMAHASVRLMLLKGDFEYGNTGLLDNTHLHFYTGREIERVFESAGYAINNLGNVHAIYPTDLVKSQLKDLGIERTSKLDKLFSKDDARIFEYIGSAIVSKDPKKVSRKQQSPDAQGTIFGWYEGQMKTKDEALKELKGQLDEQAAILNSPQELARRIRISRYMKHYVVNKTKALQRRQRKG
jgi:2-polyprenyl-3-methyl-5-hydroxy-6-metoxy-1,4-benzoquinol methylase